MAASNHPDRQYPKWYCEDCGKLLRIDPCPHCSTGDIV
jgi:rubrerythrin